jgi:hypothetical protein
MVLVGLTSFMLNVGLSQIVGVPQPHVHDEFSYLLAADTFAQGRLHNTTHPLWVHFESFHIMHQPTYASKYPPGQGMMMAIGQVVSGRPLVGVWISTALACAIIYWMLLAWMPRRWALLGGILTILHPAVIDWSHGYWGGSVAMGGGALLLGAFRRILYRLRSRDAWLMGLGMAILANSRPYEGMVLSLLVVIGLFVWIIKSGKPSVSELSRRFVLPVTITLALTFAGIGFYNLKVTGSVFCLPYSIYESTYGLAPMFLLQQLNPEPDYHHKVMRDFYTGWALSPYNSQRSVPGFIFGALGKLSSLALEYFRSIGLAISFLAIPLMLKTSSLMRLIITICVAFVVFLIPETYMKLHYAAPAVGIFLIISLRGMRHLRLWRGRWRTLGRHIVLLSLLLSLVSVASWPLGHLYIQRIGARRAQIVQELEQEAGRHLIVVRYLSDHSPHDEWVYNGANIDEAKLVWARDMERDQNNKLLDYYKDRESWLLEVGAEKVSLTPYPLTDNDIYRLNRHFQGKRKLLEAQ